MRLVVSPAALKALAALSRRDAAELLAKLEAFAADPFGLHPAAARLKGRTDAVRLRQGDWRAVCRIERSAALVIVEAIAHRREVYR